MGDYRKFNVYGTIAVTEEEVREWLLEKMETENPDIEIDINQIEISEDDYFNCARDLFSKDHVWEGDVERD